eukprot:scaffold25556_cov70-Phaeocystis_antarctica.AAC.5
MAHQHLKARGSVKEDVVIDDHDKLCIGVRNNLVAPMGQPSRCVAKPNETFELGVFRRRILVIAIVRNHHGDSGVVAANADKKLSQLPAPIRKA